MRKLYFDHLIEKNLYKIDIVKKILNLEGKVLIVGNSIFVCFLKWKHSDKIFSKLPEKTILQRWELLYLWLHLLSFCQQFLIQLGLYYRKGFNFCFKVQVFERSAPIKLNRYRKPLNPFWVISWSFWLPHCFWCVSRKKRKRTNK